MSGVELRQQNLRPLSGRFASFVAQNEQLEPRKNRGGGADLCGGTRPHAGPLCPLKVANVRLFLAETPQFASDDPSSVPSYTDVAQMLPRCTGVSLGWLG